MGRGSERFTSLITSRRMDVETKREYRDLLEDVKDAELRLMDAEEGVVHAQVMAEDAVNIRNSAVQKLEAFKAEHKV